MRTPRQPSPAEERRFRDRQLRNERARATRQSLLPEAPVETPDSLSPASESVTPAGASAPSATGHGSDWPPVSDAKLAANQANARLSTGPRTSEGKAVSSRNSFRHGFTGAFCVLPSESEEKFLLICQQYRDEHQPQTITELNLVNDLARHWWLAQRAMLLQDSVLPHCVLDVAYQKLLALYIRYQTTHQRAFHKCLNDLLRLKKLRAKEERGFVSQNDSHPPRDKESAPQETAFAPQDPPSRDLDERTNGDLLASYLQNKPGSDAWGAR